MVARIARLIGLTAILAFAVVPAAHASVHVSVHIGAPAVVAPVVSHPYGYVWQPGRYVWSGVTYRWIPGRWAPPVYDRGYGRYWRDWGHDRRWREGRGERDRRDWNRDRGRDRYDDRSGWRR